MEITANNLPELIVGKHAKIIKYKHKRKSTVVKYDQIIAEGIILKAYIMSVWPTPTRELLVVLDSGSYMIGSENKMTVDFDKDS